VAQNQVDEVAVKLEQLMMNAAELDVPLIVEAGIGDNWDQAH